MDQSTPACTHACHMDIDIDDPLPYHTAAYTAGLRGLVADLLHLNRSDFQSAIDLLDLAEDGFLEWRSTTADGRRYVDLAEDLQLREANLYKKLSEEQRALGLVERVGVL